MGNQRPCKQLIICFCRILEVSLDIVTPGNNIRLLESKANKYARVGRNLVGRIGSNNSEELTWNIFEIAYKKLCSGLETSSTSLSFSLIHTAAEINYNCSCRCDGERRNWWYLEREVEEISILCNRRSVQRLCEIVYSNVHLIQLAVADRQGSCGFTLTIRVFAVIIGYHNENLCWIRIDASKLFGRSRSQRKTGQSCLHSCHKNIAISLVNSACCGIKRQRRTDLRIRYGTSILKIYIHPFVVVKCGVSECQSQARSLTNFNVVKIWRYRHWTSCTGRCSTDLKIRYGWWI